MAQAAIPHSLPLSGYGALAKTSIAFGEVVADFCTLGIAEVVSTPTEALTRNKKTPVWFCYRNDALARVTPKHLEGEDSHPRTARPRRPACDDAGGGQHNSSGNLVAGSQRQALGFGPNLRCSLQRDRITLHPRRFKSGNSPMRMNVSSRPLRFLCTDWPQETLKKHLSYVARKFAKSFYLTSATSPRPRFCFR